MALIYIGGKSSPYRSPCGGWSVSTTPFFGGCADHYRAADASYTVYSNGTMVPNPSGPGSVPPYARDFHSFNPSCSPCAPWTEAEIATANEAGSYTATGSTVNYAVRNKFAGFKNVF